MVLGPLIWLAATAVLVVLAVSVWTAVGSEAWVPQVLAGEGIGVHSPGFSLKPLVGVPWLLQAVGTNNPCGLMLPAFFIAPACRVEAVSFLKQFQPKN